MGRIKKIVAYTLYIIGITAFFLYILFPANTVKTYIEYKIADLSPGVSIDIAAINPGFPPGLSFSDADILYRDEPAVRMDSARFSPAYLSLLSAGPGVKFSAAIAKGKVDGAIIMQTSGENPSAITRMHFEDIDLKDVHLLSSLYPGRFSGLANGRLDYQGVASATSQPAGTGSAELTISGAKIDFENPLMGLDGLAFSRITADAEMKNDQVTINRMDMEGSQFSASGSGILSLRHPVASSRLDLEGVITLHPELMRSLGPLLPKQYLKNDEIAVRITGTVAEPRYSVR